MDHTHRLQCRVAFCIVRLQVLGVRVKFGAILFKVHNLVFAIRDYLLFDFVKFFRNSHLIRSARVFGNSDGSEGLGETKQSRPAASSEVK